jgi:hypothetical protein
MRTTEAPGGLGDRGVGVQAAGFVIVGCVCLSVLQLWPGSDHFLYLWFETAVTKLYWTFVVPLAATFDWGRKMFEKGKAIREAKKAEILAKALERERHRIRVEMERNGIPVTPELEAILSGDVPAGG